MANHELGRIDRIRCVLDSIDSAVRECNRVRWVLLRLHRGFDSCLNERGLGKQLLVLNGIWRVLIDILSSVFPFFIITSVIAFSRYVGMFCCFAVLLFASLSSFCVTPSIKRSVRVFSKFGFPVFPRFFSLCLRLSTFVPRESVCARGHLLEVSSVLNVFPRFSLRLRRGFCSHLARGRFTAERGDYLLRACAIYVIMPT